MSDTPVAERSPRNAWTLALAGLGAFMAALDVVVVSTALPTLQSRLGAGLADLEWTISAYSLVFGALMLTGAALGDRFGRRRMYVPGLVTFGAGSTVAALASGAGMLIAARVVEGAGAAMLVPLTLTLISDAFPADRFGNRPFMVTGLLLQATGLGWLAAAAGPGTGYGTLVTPLIIAGIGTALCFPTVANQVTGSVPAAGIGVAAGTSNALNALGGVFGIAIMAAIFAAHGSYHTHATFISGFRPAEWAAAGSSALGVIAAALAPAKSATADRVTPAPELAPARQPA